ncbi:hypothetical protein [Erysipelothrix tonsillarum]|uniref:hypothetical protein n=1 Tax=Erysipelothrix tonsillarum TaxID=38402 RepID=UPI0039C79732
MAEGAGKSIDLKMLFQGKRKWITIGAIVLVVVLALVMRNRSSSSTTTYGTSVDDIARGAAAPGLTTTDIQNAISEYAEKDAEQTASMFDKITQANSDALNSVVESNQKQWDAAQDQWESMGDMLADVQEQNNKNNQSLLDQLNQSMQNMQNQWNNQFNNLANQYGPGYGAGSGGGSSSSGSSSTPSVSGSATTRPNASGGSFQDAADQYINNNPGLSQSQQNTVNQNAQTAQNAADKLNGGKGLQGILNPKK